MATSPKQIEQQLLQTLTYQNPVQQDQVTDPTIQDLIHKACVEGDWKTLQETLELNNLSVNCKMRRFGDLTPLGIAVQNNQINLVSILVKQKGINLECHSRHLRIREPLWHALDIENKFRNANYEMARVLMAAGADIEESAMIWPMSVLLHAWFAGNSTAAQLAIEYNANISNAAVRSKDSDTWSSMQEIQSEERVHALHQQIALSKKYRLTWPQDIGITLSQISSKLPKALNLYIASFVFDNNSRQMRALHRVYALLSEHRATVALHYQYAPVAPVPPPPPPRRPIRDGKPIPPPPPPRKGL